MKDIANVTVLGTGVLGSQIAFQTAFSGFAVTAYDISAEALEAASERFDALGALYQNVVDGADAARTAAARDRITLTTDLAAAAAHADLIIEAVPERMDIKQLTYQRLAPLLPEHTILTTNSSTLLPSDIAAFTQRPEKFLALHFANEIWVHNTAEVMGTRETNSDVFNTVVDFASAIGMVPVPMHKERPGYVLNSLLVPFLNAALDVAAGGYAEPADIDNVWRIATGAPLGPFEIYDRVGLSTAYNILSNGSEHERQLAAWLKENYVDRGRLGTGSGAGFYDYSNA